jgi:hypothetical protein
VVIWSSDRADCEDFRLNRAWTQWNTHIHRMNSKLV